MGNDPVEVTRRRLLGGLITVASVSGAAGAGTVAHFSHTETSSDNTIQAGTVDLQLDGEDRTVTFLEEQDIVPGDDGLADIDLSNAGSVDGHLKISVADIRSTDSKEKDPVELEQHLKVQGEMVEDDVVVFDWQTIEEIRDNTIEHPEIRLAADGSKTFYLNWRLPEDTDNDARGDSVEIDFNFRLTQTGRS